MKALWRIIELCLHRYYPPRIWVFYPLYKLFRRRLRLPMALSNFLVWVASALLHGFFVALCGDITAALVFAGIFIFLGALSSLLIVFGKRRNGKIYLGQ